MLPCLYETFCALSWEYRDRITPIRATTHQGLQQIADAGLRPDLIFVDADHSFDAVMADLEHCEQLFPEARLVGDDYEAPSVRKAVDNFARERSRTVEAVGKGWVSWRVSPPARMPIAVPAPFELTSIVIVTFNELAFTKECVDSITLRTNEPYELIFVDNGSVDGTPGYLQSIKNAKVILNQDNRGFPAAVNQGLRFAKGRQVLFAQ